MKIDENTLLQLCNAAITAGNRVLDFYELDTEIIYKKDESPLTKADLDSNKILLKQEPDKAYNNLDLKATLEGNAEVENTIIPKKKPI